MTEVLSKPVPYVGWAGKHPMSPAGSEKEGPKELPANANPLNVVQAKEASVMIHWLEAQLNEIKAGDKDEVKKRIQDLVDKRLPETAAM